MTMDEIEVLVTDDQLSIRGTREIQPPAESTALRRERITGAFERSIQLPAQIDIERVEARLNQGVLMITLPKAAVCMPRKIKVNALPDDS